MIDFAIFKVKKYYGSLGQSPRVMRSSRPKTFAGGSPRSADYNRPCVPRISIMPVGSRVNVGLFAGEFTGVIGSTWRDLDDCLTRFTHFRTAALQSELIRDW